MAEILYACSRCIHSEVCSYKVSYQNTQDEVFQLMSKILGRNDSHFTPIGFECKHFKVDPRPPIPR